MAKNTLVGENIVHSLAQNGFLQLFFILTYLCFFFNVGLNTISAVGCVKWTWEASKSGGGGSGQKMARPKTIKMIDDDEV